MPLGLSIYMCVCSVSVNKWKSVLNYNVFGTYACLFCDVLYMLIYVTKCKPILKKLLFEQQHIILLLLIIGKL